MFFQKHSKRTSWILQFWFKKLLLFISNKFKNKSTNDKKKKILYVGSRLKYKNFDNLLKALSLNNGLPEDFKLICFGEESLSIKEKYLIENLK